MKAGEVLEYYAHKFNEKKQTVKEHLFNTAELSKGFSVDFMKEIAYQTGLMHDIGKYSKAFQRHLNEENVKFEHSTCGALEISKMQYGTYKELAFMMQYCIAGHHTGLPDGGTVIDNADGDTTLHSRLNRKDKYVGECDYSVYLTEIEPKIPDFSELIKKLSDCKNKNELFDKYAFFTRYLFSCLTDADFLDTEQFVNPDIDRQLNADFMMIENAVNKKISELTAVTPLQKARSNLQSQAIQNCKESNSVCMLNMPTGSGKTLCSLKIALEKLKKTNKKRIIYVIPYTSIIEQTAELFDSIFGNYANILQHHSNYCFENDDENVSTDEKKRLASENWDAPIIITTSVQFFESLYHNKSSKLRKIHNMSDSVIIFDEIHMLPVSKLMPCLRGISYITKYLNSEVIMMSATMPDFASLFEKFTSNQHVTDLITDTSDYKYFCKCRYINLGKTDLDSVIEKASHYRSSLIIVNSRRKAREVYAGLTGKKYHLSTYMTPRDRSATIENIKSDLKNNERITVVSTSLVEAGVDFDFEVVFRQLAGLDSILQSGGRCNREGKMETGDVYIFETDESLNGDLKIRASIVNDLLKTEQDISSQHAVEEYYNRLFRFREEEIENNSIYEISGSSLDGIAFRTYAEKFRFIENNTVGVIIDNCEETAELISKFEYGGLKVRRMLQKYMVSIYVHGELDMAVSKKIVKNLGNDIYVLKDKEYYNEETGLNLEMNHDVIFG